MTNKTKKLRIAMAGGGTGGHVFPIKSLLEFLKHHPSYDKRIEKLYWFGSKNSLEQKICHEIQERDIQKKLHFISIFSGKYRRESYRKSQIKNISDIFLFILGFFQSFFFLLYNRIDVIFCKGGYVALPVILAAALLHKKIIVHESDAHSGLVNKIASRFAKTTFTGFDGVLKNSKTIGQILSDDIIIDTHPEFTPKTLVLVTGGSQGSQRLYNHMYNILSSVPQLQENYEFFFVLGLINEEMSKVFDKFPHVHSYSFLSQKEMGELYNMCDIVITRGGATSLAEQKLYDLKQIIIPIPWTHDQYDNAKRYHQEYNDIWINQRDRDFEKQLTQTILDLKGFKKTHQKKDKKSIIFHAKKVIWDELVS